jgi:hypothetical protein
VLPAPIVANGPVTVASRPTIALLFARTRWAASQTSQPAGALAARVQRGRAPWPPVLAMATIA